MYSLFNKPRFTPLTYHTNNRLSHFIISVIKEAQYKFFAKLGTLDEDEALVISILRLCENTPIVEYYKSLLPDSKKSNVEEREQRVIESNAPMLQYYRSIMNPKKKSSIYSSFADDHKRAIITRWRLSNHKLP